MLEYSNIIPLVADALQVFDPTAVVGLLGLILAPISGIVYWRAQVKAKTVMTQDFTIKTQGATIAAQGAAIKAKNDQIAAFQGEMDLKEIQAKRHLDNLSKALQTVETLSYKTDLTPLVDKIGRLMDKSDERWSESMKYISDDMEARKRVNTTMEDIATEVSAQTSVLQKIVPVLEEIKKHMATSNGNAEKHLPKT